MKNGFKLLAICATTLAINAPTAHSALVDLGITGTFNAYVLGDFNGANSSSQGAVAAAGDFNAKNYSINQSNIDGVGPDGYALAVQGSLSYMNGSIRDGLIYAGGSRTLKNVGLSGAESTQRAPLAFNDASNDVMSLSRDLARLSDTGSSAIAHGGMTITGTGTPATVLGLSGAALSKINHFKFSNLARNDTLVLNISGKEISLQGGWNSFASYNVLFNFHEATSIRLNGVAVYGSILAPLATLEGGSGAIHGNAVVGQWNSSIALNASHYFVPADVPGFALATPVPEPRTYALLVAGLGIVGWFAWRRKS
jgi:choice-of-anchor A domain-containing protein